jgi:hypothetical protein
MLRQNSSNVDAGIYTVDFVVREVQSSWHFIAHVRGQTVHDEKLFFIKAARLGGHGDD